MTQRIWLLLLAIALFNGGQLLWSQESNVEELGEIVITARRTPQPYSETPDNVSIMTAEDIARLPVHDLSEAIHLINGVDVQGRGSFGQPASATIQGSDPAHTRIMVDGVLLNTQGTAFANPALIPLENVERIEVIKGTGSAAWGSSLGGVINVITKKPKDQSKPTGSLTVTGAGGEIGFWKESFEVSGQAGKLGYLLWESRQDANNHFRDNSDFLENSSSAKLTYDLNETTNLFTTFHYTRQLIGGYEFPTLAYGEDYMYNSRYGTVGFNLAPSDTFDINAAYKTSDQANNLTRFAVPGKTVIADIDTKDVFTGVDINSNLRLSDKQTLAFGVDTGKDRLDSDQTNGPEREKRYGVYANHNWIVSESWSLTLGARYDDTTAYGEQFSPMGGVVYHLPIKTNIRASFSRAFNAPQLIFKYVAGNPFVIPNEDLKAERGWVYELSMDTKPTETLWIKIGAYRADVKDLVQLVTIAPFTWQADNVALTRRQGLEAEVKYEATKKLTASAGWTLNRVQDRTTGTLMIGNGVPRTTARIGLNYQHEKLLTVNLIGHYHFWNEPSTNRPKDRRFIWDARANYDLKDLTGQDLSTFVNLLNIFDRENYYNQLLPNPGLRIELGLKYGF